MKKQLLAAALLILSAIGIQTASAQNYQPFSRNLTYHFSAQDSIYALKIDTSYVQNGDSVFVFNDIAKRVYFPNSNPCVNYGTPYLIHGNNQFGQKMIKKPNGVYLFETIQGDQFEVRTNAAIGQSWPFRIGHTTTATLTAKTVDPVLTTTDSVLTLTLSTGEIIKLSKNYGFLKVPNFASYADSYFPTKDLTFHALPEKQLGNSVNDPFYIFDYQQGDIFGYYYFEEVGSSSSLPCFERWTRDEILSRTLSPSGNAIIYQIQREVLTRGHGFPGAPSGFCSRTPGFTLYPTTTYTLTVSRTNPLYTKFFSQHYYVASGSQPHVISGLYKDASYNNWERINLKRYSNYSPGCKTFGLGLDGGTDISYVAGLGMVRLWSQVMGDHNLEVLQAYRKNGVVYGNLRTMAQIMSVSKDKELAPAIAIFPNPAENAATLKFDQPLTSGKLTVTVVNTMGQTALQQEFTEAPEQQINLNLEKLAKGIYVVQAAQNGKTFTTRFVKQ